MTYIYVKHAYREDMYSATLICFTTRSLCESTQERDYQVYTFEKCSTHILNIHENVQLKTKAGTKTHKYRGMYTQPAQNWPNIYIHYVPKHYTHTCISGVTFPFACPPTRRSRCPNYTGGPLARPSPSAKSVDGPFIRRFPGTPQQHSSSSVSQ